MTWVRSFSYLSLGLIAMGQLTVLILNLTAVTNNYDGYTPYDALWAVTALAIADFVHLTGLGLGGGLYLRAKSGSMYDHWVSPHSSHAVRSLVVDVISIVPFGVWTFNFRTSIGNPVFDGVNDVEYIFFHISLAMAVVMELYVFTSYIALLYTIRESDMRNAFTTKISSWLKNTKGVKGKALSKKASNEEEPSTDW